MNTTLTYDAVSRLASMFHNLAGTSGDITFGYGYNAASQMVTRSRSNDGYVYGGDVPVARHYSVNGLNQYVSAGGASFGYDANGNLTSDGASSYVYDVENRLVSASGATTASLRYDPLGRLYETSGGSAGITRFLYDGDELVGEYSSAGTTLRRYAHGPGSDDPLIWYEGSTMGTTNRRVLLTDHQGSIVSVANDTGALVTINRYDDWGVPDASNAGRFQYTGQAWIPELNMYHYKARIYSPTLGRFMQTDPIGYDDGPHLYAYVGNDPVNGRDPDGLAVQAIIGGIVGGGLEVGIQVFVEGKDLKDVDLGDVGIAVVAGAAGQGLLKQAGRILSADLKAVRAQEAARKAADRVSRAEQTGSNRQVRSAAFQASRRATAAREATREATRTTVRAAAVVGGTAAAKKVTPPVSCKEGVRSCK